MSTDDHFYCIPKFCYKTGLELNLCNTIILIIAIIEVLAVRTVEGQSERCLSSFDFSLLLKWEN